jgi:hypothetical protein
MGGALLLLFVVARMRALCSYVDFSVILSLYIRSSTEAEKLLRLSLLLFSRAFFSLAAAAGGSRVVLCCHHRSQHKKNEEEAISLKLAHHSLITFVYSYQEVWLTYVC